MLNTSANEAITIGRGVAFSRSSRITFLLGSFGTPPTVGGFREDRSEDVGLAGADGEKLGIFPCSGGGGGMLVIAANLLNAQEQKLRIFQVANLITLRIKSERVNFVY